MQSNACNWWDTMTVERRVFLFLLWLESSMRSNWCESWSRWCMCTFMPIANHVLSRMHFTDWVRLLLYLQKWQDEVKSWSGKLIFFSLLQYIIYAATRGKQTRTARAFFPASSMSFRKNSKNYLTTCERVSFASSCSPSQDHRSNGADSYSLASESHFLLQWLDDNEWPQVVPPVQAAPSFWRLHSPACLRSSKACLRHHPQQQIDLQHLLTMILACLEAIELMQLE